MNIYTENNTIYALQLLVCNMSTNSLLLYLHTQTYIYIYTWMVDQKDCLAVYKHHDQCVKGMIT